MVKVTPTYIMDVCEVGDNLKRSNCPDCPDYLDCPDCFDCPNSPECPGCPDYPDCSICPVCSECPDCPACKYCKYPWIIGPDTTFILMGSVFAFRAQTLHLLGREVPLLLWLDTTFSRLGGLVAQERELMDI